MTVQQFEGGHRAADVGLRPLKRRRFLRTFATLNLTLLGGLAACGRRGDLKPPPAEPETSAPEEKEVQ